MGADRGELLDSEVVGNFEFHIVEQDVDVRGAEDLGDFCGVKTGKHVASDVVNLSIIRVSERCGEVTSQILVADNGVS